MSKTHTIITLVVGAVLALLAIAVFGFTVRMNQCRTCGVQEYERSFLGIVVESWCEREYDEFGTYAEWKKLYGKNSCTHQFEPVGDSGPVKTLDDLGHNQRMHQTPDGAGDPRR